MFERVEVAERFQQLADITLSQVSPYPERIFTGRISFIVPGVDAATRTFQVKARVANANGVLSPDLFARVTTFSAAVPISPPSIPIRNFPPPPATRSRPVRPASSRR